MNMKKAILLVSFGTSYPVPLKKTIGAIEAKIMDTFPDFLLYKAFINQRIIDNLRKNDNLCIDNIEEAMKRMASDGIQSIVIQFANIINGIEHDKVLSEIKKYQHLYKRIRIGEPLLSGAEDYKKVVHAVMSVIKPREDEILVLMGRGSSHHASSAYPALEYTFHALGYDRVLVGTIEGFPDLNNVIAKLNIAKTKKVILMPFLLIAGGYAQKDMIGDDDSWMTRLQDAGYDVNTIITGLGEIEGIRNIFIEHIEEVL